VRVLDLSRYLPGPMATLLLADFGADVLKIEGPDGDEMQHLGPRDAEGRPLFYRALNAGKHVRRMNLKDPAARETFLALVAEADVLIETFRPGVMPRLGIDYPVLAAINPGLVWCSLSGYGADGPLAGHSGHDANYLAQAGVLHRQAGGQAGYFDPPVADHAGALYAVIAILGALRARDRDGRGAHLDLSLADSIMPLQTFQVADFGERGVSYAPDEMYLNGGAAWYRVYRTADARHVVLGAAGDKFWRNFCAAADRMDWFERGNAPTPHRALIAELEAYFEGLTQAEAVARFVPADCCFSAVVPLDTALDSAQVRARGLVRRAPDGALQALFPARVDNEPPAARPPVATTGAGFTSRLKGA